MKKNSFLLKWLLVLGISMLENQQIQCSARRSNTSALLTSGRPTGPGRRSTNLPTPIPNQSHQPHIPTPFSHDILNPQSPAPLSVKSPSSIASSQRTGLVPGFNQSELQLPSAARGGNLPSAISSGSSTHRSHEPFPNGILNPQSPAPLTIKSPSSIVSSQRTRPVTGFSPNELQIPSAALEGKLPSSISSGSRTHKSAGPLPRGLMDLISPVTGEGLPSSISSQRTRPITGFSRDNLTLAPATKGGELPPSISSGSSTSKPPHRSLIDLISPATGEGLPSSIASSQRTRPVTESDNRSISSSESSVPIRRIDIDNTFPQGPAWRTPYTPESPREPGMKPITPSELSESQTSTRPGTPPTITTRTPDTGDITPQGPAWRTPFTPENQREPGMKPITPSELSESQLSNDYLEAPYPRRDRFLSEGQMGQPGAISSRPLFVSQKELKQLGTEKGLITNFPTPSAPEKTITSDSELSESQKSTLPGTPPTRTPDISDMTPQGPARRTPYAPRSPRKPGMTPITPSQLSESQTINDYLEAPYPRRDRFLSEGQVGQPGAISSRPLFVSQKELKQLGTEKDLITTFPTPSTPDEPTVMISQNQLKQLGIDRSGPLYISQKELKQLGTEKDLITTFPTPPTIIDEIPTPSAPDEPTVMISQNQLKQLGIDRSGPLYISQKELKQLGIAKQEPIYISQNQLKQLGIESDGPIYISEKELTQMGIDRSGPLYLSQNQLKQLGIESSKPLYISQKQLQQMGIAQAEPIYISQNQLKQLGIESDGPIYISEKELNQMGIDRSGPLYLSQNQLKQLGIESSEPLYISQKQLQQMGIARAEKINIPPIKPTTTASTGTQTPITGISMGTQTDEPTTTSTSTQTPPLGTSIGTGPDGQPINIYITPETNIIQKKGLATWVVPAVGALVVGGLIIGAVALSNDDDDDGDITIINRNIDGSDDEMDSSTDSEQTDTDTTLDNTDNSRDNEQTDTNADNALTDEASSGDESSE